MSRTDTQDIKAYIDQHQRQHVEKIQEFLRQPSISDENIGIAACAELLKSYYQDLGCSEARLIPTSGYPGVWAYYDAGAPKTIVNYCMYDVMPVAGEEWIAPPFAAEIVDKAPFGPTLIARGAINSKGPYRMWLNALESIIATRGQLPVNIMFVAEGEEELGSPHFPEIVQAVEDRLATADAVLNLATGQDQRGQVSMYLGFKGVIDFELRASGSRWGRGPQAHAIHSSLKAVVDSPVWRMVQALSTLVSEDGNRVLIDGFYDDVMPPSEEDEELIQALLEGFDPESWRQQNQIGAWMDGLSKEEVIRRYLFASTLNITGIGAGYTGPGCKTILPHEILCKFDIRLVPNQNSPDMLPRLRAHLDRRGYQDLEITQLSGYEWSRTSVKSAPVQALLRTYQQYGLQPLIWPTTGGSAPMYLFTRPPLGLPLVSGGIGHGGGAHAPNEYLVVEGTDRVAGLTEAEKFCVDVLYEFADT